MSQSSRNPGLDGIRGLAVSLVILFHARVPGFSGAYFAVEMFFVLSGFVIWSAVIRRQGGGRPEPWRQFLRRRFRRIVPALLPVLVASSLAASLVFLPDDRDAALRVAVAAILFASNFVLAADTGYFSGQEAQPLLHTWSLSVEMQLYLLVPLLFSVFAAARQHGLAVLAAISGLAFVAGEGIGQILPDAAYFLPVSRLWQFLAGAMLATVLARMRPPAPASAAAAGVAGAGMLLLAGALTPDQAWSNTGALLPVLGTLGLIVASTHGTAPRLLTLGPLLFLGEISYSLYLWHLPVLVVTDYLLPGRSGIAATLAALAASLVLATVSWRLLERPFLTATGRKIFQPQRE